MAREILDSILNDIASDEKVVFQNQLQELLDLAHQPLDLQHFLNEFLLRSCQLFAANAGVIWFADEAKSRLEAKAEVQIEHLLLDNETHLAHDQLLRDGMSLTSSVVVKPFSAIAPQATSCNPTDSFLVLGPVRIANHTLALVELVLGPKPLRGQTTELQAAYGRWLDYVLASLSDGIERRFLRANATLTPALERLRAVSDEVQDIQQMILKRIEQSLQAFAGMNFGTLKSNQEFANSVHALLDRHGFRVICPECGAPAILRCQKAGNSKSGAFVFDHYLETGRTFHGGPSTFPNVKLTTKPPRRKRGS